MGAYLAFMARIGFIGQPDGEGGEDLPAVRPIGDE